MFYLIWYHCSPEIICNLRHPIHKQLSITWLSIRLQPDFDSDMSLSPRAVTNSPTSNALTDEQAKDIELNRLRAKAKIRAQSGASSKISQSSNVNGKRPLAVTEGDSMSPKKQKVNSDDINAPLKRDSRLMGTPQPAIGYSTQLTTSPH